MDVLAEAQAIEAAGTRVIHMEVGEPAHGAPRAAREALAGLGFTDISPADGAFYAYAGVSRLTDDSREFCARLLSQAGVAATPGLDFDPVRGHATVRFSFAQAPDKIAEGIERLAGFIEAGAGRG